MQYEYRLRGPYNDRPVLPPVYLMYVPLDTINKKETVETYIPLGQRFKHGNSVSNV